MGKFNLKNIFFCLFLLCYFSAQANQDKHVIDYQIHQQFEPAVQYLENKNQWHPNAFYKGSLQDGAVYLEDQRLTFVYWDTQDFLDRHDELHHLRHEDEFHEELLKQYDGLRVKGHAYYLNFLGSNPNSVKTSSGKSEHHYSYFLGKDESKWASKVHSFKTVNYSNIYDGIDLDVYSTGHHLKYDFIVEANADPSAIELQYEHVDDIRLVNDQLIITNSINQVTEVEPYVYQIIDGKKIDVEASYILEKNVVTFDLGEYDSNHKLVIDPILIVGSYSGSTTTNYGMSASFDYQGHVYTGGLGFGDGYPATPGAFDVTFNDPAGGGGGGGYYGFGTDAVISKLTPDGTTLVWAAYVGGSSSDNPFSMYCNSDDEMYVYGITSSDDMPMIASGYLPTLPGSGGGGYYYTNSAYIFRLSEDGSTLMNSTYMGGTGGTYDGEIYLDANNDVFVTATTGSDDHPTTPGSLMPAAPGSGGGYYGFSQSAVVYKLNSTLTNLEWGTYFGGDGYTQGNSIRVADDGTVYSTGTTSATDIPTTANAYQPTAAAGGGGYGGGNNAYVLRLSSDGSTAVNCTYFSPTASEGSNFIDLDTYNQPVIYGTQNSGIGTFPYTPSTVWTEGEGNFIVKFKPDLDSLVWATTFGATGGGGYYGFGSLAQSAFMVDVCNNVYAAGYGAGTGMPITPDADWSTPNGGSDFYFIVLDEDAENHLYSTYIGASDSDHNDGGTSRFDKRGRVYHAVCTAAGDFPTTPTAVYPNALTYGYDICVFKYDFEQVGLQAQVEILVDGLPSAEGCAPLTVQFENIGFGGILYDWDFGDGIGTSTDENPAYVYTEPGLYEVALIVNDPNSCIINDTAYGYINVLSEAALADFDTDESTDCVEMTVDFNNLSISANTYEWDFGDGVGTSSDMNPTYTYTTPGVYDVTLSVSDTSGCATPDVISYQVTFAIPTEPLNAQFSTSESGDCDFLDVIFSNTTADADTWLWDFGDGIGTSTDENPNYTYTSPGNYTVTLSASDSNGCFDPDVSTFDINYSPALIDEIALIDLTECSGNALQFSTPTSAQYYEWDFGDNNYSDIANPEHIYEEEGSYTVNLVVIDSATCNITNSASAQVNIIGTPDALFSISSDVVDLNETVIFTFPNLDNVPNFEWNFDDGSTNSSDEINEHFYNQTGEYEICLTIATANGCPSSHCERLIVETEASVGVPNAFSPNNDGNNDVLYVRGFNVLELDFKVFNRWGEMVFQTDNLDDGWDGIYKGQLHEMDVLVYVLNARLTTGEFIENETGNISLLR